MQVEITPLPQCVPFFGDPRSPIQMLKSLMAMHRLLITMRDNNQMILGMCVEALFFEDDKLERLLAGQFNAIFPANCCNIHMDILKPHDLEVVRR